MNASLESLTLPRIDELHLPKLDRLLSKDSLYFRRCVCLLADLPLNSPQFVEFEDSWQNKYNDFCRRRPHLMKKLSLLQDHMCCTVSLSSSPCPPRLHPSPRIAKRIRKSKARHTSSRGVYQPSEKCLVWLHKPWQDTKCVEFPYSPHAFSPEHHTIFLTAD